MIGEAGHKDNASYFSFYYKPPWLFQSCCNRTLLVSNTDIKCFVDGPPTVTWKDKCVSAVLPLAATSTAGLFLASPNHFCCTSWERLFSVGAHWGCQLIYKKTAIDMATLKGQYPSVMGQTLHLKYTGQVHMLTDSLDPKYFLSHVWVLLDQEKPFQQQKCNFFHQCTEIESASQE